MIIQSPKDGSFLGYKKNFIENDFVDTLVDLEVTPKIGESVSILRKGTDRIGKVVVTSKNSSEAEIIAKKIISKISIEVD